jgi:adhesin/invasin
MSSARILWHCLLVGLLLPLAACHRSDDPTATIDDDTIQATTSVKTAAAVVGGNDETVSITFVSSDSQLISNLSVSGLEGLPAGWSGPAKFSCGAVSTGSGCVLNLTYAPNAVGDGTVSLTYSFVNAGGASMSGAVAIPYSATSTDDVVTTAAPTGQITAAVNSGSQAVTVTFDTNDGQAATGLTLASSLSSLPAGWGSTATSFTCASVSTGNSCQLALTFAPMTGGSGTLTLDYGYTDNSGAAKTGSVSIPYTATTDDNVAGTVSPSGQVTANVGGSATSVSVTFATDDGNPASNLEITAGLSSPPSGWSGPGSFSCGTVSAGTACQLALSYAPQYTDNGTLTLSYSYDNDEGNAKTGTINVPYSAIGPHLYVANVWTELDECAIGADSTLSTCARTPSSGGPQYPSGIAFNGNTAYVTDFGNAAIDACAVNADGSLSSCSAYSSFPANWQPWSLTVNTASNGNTYLYASDENSLYGKVEQCTLAVDGSISSCTPTASGVVWADGIAFGAGYAYISALNGSYVVDVCNYNSDGTISGCTSTGGGFNFPAGVAINGGYVYVTNQHGNNVSECTIGANGVLSSCSTSALPGAYDPNWIVFSGSQAYVDDQNGNVWLCSVDAGNGSLTNCAQAKGSNSFSASQELALH